MLIFIISFVNTHAEKALWRQNHVGLLAQRVFIERQLLISAIMALADAKLLAKIANLIKMDSLNMREGVALTKEDCSFPGARLERLNEAHSDRSHESSRGVGNCGDIEIASRAR
jgi:hypothetical protein